MTAGFDGGFGAFLLLIHCQTKKIYGIKLGFNREIAPNAALNEIIKSDETHFDIKPLSRYIFKRSYI